MNTNVIKKITRSNFLNPGLFEIVQPFHQGSLIQWVRPAPVRLQPARAVNAQKEADHDVCSNIDWEPNSSTLPFSTEPQLRGEDGYLEPLGKHNSIFCLRVREVSYSEVWQGDRGGSAQKVIDKYVQLGKETEQRLCRISFQRGCQYCSRCGSHRK